MKRLLLVLLALLVAVPIGAFAAATLLLNGDAVRARAVDAVRRATGRELVIAGPIRLAWSLTPTIEARDVSLLNPPGMSRPATARLDRVEAQVALLPLLARRVELRRVVLAGPDILFERDAAGRPNWLLTPPAPPQAGPAATAPDPQPRFETVLGQVEIRDARVAWRGGGPAIDAVAPRLTLAAQTGRLGGELTVNGVPIALGGTAGPFAATGPWPLDVNLVGGGLAATIAGTTARAAVTVLAPDLAAAAPLAGRALPAIRDVKLAAILSGAGSNELSVQAGPSALGGNVRLRGFRASASSLAEPVAATGDIRVGELPIAVAVNVGSLRALLGRGPIPVQALATTGDATLSAQGTVADLRGGGFDLALSGRAAGLARLAALAGVPAPALRDVALEARLASAPGAVLVRGLRLLSAQGDIAGDLAIGLQPRPSLRGSLVSQRLALDEWALSSAPAPAPAPPEPPTSSAPAPAPAASDRVIPDLLVPFAALGRADADLRASIGEAVWRGASYRAVEFRLLLQDGRLRLAPLSAQTPGGVAFAQVVADAASQLVSVTARAPGLAAGPVLALLGAPDSTKGTLDLDLQLRGEGPTLRALAATLEGQLGLAMVDGEVENRWLEMLFAGAMRAANLPVVAGGASRVRCLALRAEAVAGQVRLRTLVLDTTRLKLEAEGGLDLGRETLDLRLRPQLRLGTTLSVPVRLSGTFRSPKAALDAGAIAPGRVGVVIGGPTSGDACGPALALARDGQAGPPPAAPEPPSRPARPAELLRQLLR